MRDVEIAQATQMQPISSVVSPLGVTMDDLELYGKYKAKITMEAMQRIINTNKKGKLILVTAINPTPAGEGKTTTMIGLHQAMHQMGEKSMVAMREPSLGPCFGIKGGAAGGGYAQVVPMEDINLHFTGDMHAITSANNLIAALLDNSLQQGNPLHIDARTIVWKRVVDLNDRALRHTICGLGGKVNGVPREDGFDITVASEVMAVLCLASDMADLKRRIARMIVAYNEQGMPVTVDDLQATGAVSLLLKDAIKPNFVQTLDHAPVLVHGGPFANIAHGCNSLLATNLAMHLADYTITEAGFGADLGAEKFLDIACRKGDMQPDAVLIVATIRALKMHGGVSKDALSTEDVEAMQKGSENLAKHVENIRKFGLSCMVAINVFPTDSVTEIQELIDICHVLQVPVSISEVFAKGAEGGKDMALQLLNLLEKESSDFQYLYDENESIENKIETIATEIYGANKVILSKKAKNKIRKYVQLGMDKLPICVAKTQYSLSDQPQLLGRPKDFAITIQDIIVNAGAGFIVALAGDVMRMPGLPKTPAAVHMDIMDDGTITGLF